MSLYRVLSTLRSTTLISKDNVVNTFHLEATGFSLAGHATPVTAAWKTFMDAVRPNLAGLAQTGHTLRFYSLVDPQPRAPVATTTWDFATAPVAMNGPRELAVCLNYQADRASGVPQARRRGRMYFGPITSTTTGTERPSNALQDAFLNGLETFIEAVNAITGCEFVVYSRVNGTGVPTSELWTDDAWDVQRRRGNDPTAKRSRVLTTSP